MSHIEWTLQLALLHFVKRELSTFGNMLLDALTYFCFIRITYVEKPVTFLIVNCHQVDVKIPFS